MLLQSRVSAFLPCCSPHPGTPRMWCLRGRCGVFSATPKGRRLSQAPGLAPLLPAYPTEAPLLAHPQSHSCPRPRGDLILPGTSCACFLCILCRQEMGMRWKVKEGGRKVSLSLLAPSFRARWCLPSHWRPKSSGCRGDGRGRLLERVRACRAPPQRRKVRRGGGYVAVVFGKH